MSALRLSSLFMLAYTHLLFDADGTLYDFHATEKIALKQLFDHYKIASSEENIALYHKGNSQCWKLYEEGSLSMDELKTLRVKLFFDELGLKDDPKEAGELFITYLSEHGILIDGALEVLEKLSKCYTLIMITNGIAKVQRGRLLSSDTEKYYKDIIISEEIGVQKPNKEYMTKTLERIKADKDKCLIIGDSLTSDIQGGINSGIDTLYLHLNKEADGEKVWKYDASSYKELLSLLL